MWEFNITCLKPSPFFQQFYLQRLANSSSSDPVSEVCHSLPICPRVFWSLLLCRLYVYNPRISQGIMQPSLLHWEMGPFVACTTHLRNWACQIVKFCLFGWVASVFLKLTCIWHSFQGTADNTVPYKYAARMQELLPQSELITVQGGRHDLTVSHPETIVSAFTRFFGSR